MLQVNDLYKNVKFALIFNSRKLGRVFSAALFVPPVTALIMFIVMVIYRKARRSGLSYVITKGR